MASGLALLSSGVGGASEVFEDGKTDFNLKLAMRKPLAEQIKRLFDEPGLLRALQENALERARNRFDVQRSAQQLEELLTNLNQRVTNQAFKISNR